MSESAVAFMIVTGVSSSLNPASSGGIGGVSIDVDESIDGYDRMMVLEKSTARVP
jgi:hypothetical protein